MSDLKKVYKEIDLERSPKCTGCDSVYQLTHSHIVPRSQDKSLEDDKENITLHCVPCHTIWEHSSMRVFMKDFIPNMLYAYKSSQTFYWKRFYKMQEIFDKDKDEKKRTKALLILNALSQSIENSRKIKT